MKFYSTKNSANTATFREALLTGMPVDKGLCMPESIPDLSNIYPPNFPIYKINSI